MRFKDSPNLFGVGMGSSTCGEITCDICGKTYNKGADDDNLREGNYVRETTFEGLTVVECCFERIENAVFDRISDTLKRCLEILNEQEKELAKRGIS